MNLSEKSRLWLRLLNCLLLLVFIVSVFSCKKKESDTTKAISHAIDVFFLENYFDSVLVLLDYPAFLNSPPTKHNDLKIIFSAASLCENGYADSARTLLNTIKTPIKNPKNNYYYQSVDGLIDYRKNRFDEAYRKFLSIVSQDVQDVRALALSERMIGRIMKILTDYKSSINWFLLSKQHFKEADLEKSVAVTSKFLGSSCTKSRLFSEATKYFFYAEDIFEKYDDKDELFYLYIVMTDLYVQQNRLDSAKYYAHKAENVVNFRQDKRMLSNVYNSLGEIEMLMGNYQTSLDLFQQTIDLGNDYYSAPNKKKFAYYARGKVYNLIREPIKAYEELQKALLLIGNSQQGIKVEVLKEIAKATTSKNSTTANDMIDSTLVVAKEYYTSQSANIVNSLITQKELEVMKVDVDHMIDQRKKLAVATIVSIVVLLIIIFLLLRSRKIKIENNKILYEIAQKNLQLLQEERKLNKTIRESNIKLKSNKKKHTEDQRSRIIYSDLIEWLEKDQNFMRNDLNLDVVSKELGTNRDYLSRAINDQLVRFPDLINRYRINEAISILSDNSDKRSKYNLQVIATEVGFNSYSVFVDAFRKQTSMTPVQFRDSVNPED